MKMIQRLKKLLIQFILRPTENVVALSEHFAVD